MTSVAPRANSGPYRLHVGKGRPWNVDSKSDEFLRETHPDDPFALRRLAITLEEEIDWWTIFDEDYRYMMGWSTGRTTVPLMEADRAYSTLR